MFATLPYSSQTMPSRWSIISQQSQRSCMNCGQIHQVVPGKASVHCSMIGCRTSRSRGAQGTDTNTANSEDFVTIPMPTTIRDQAILFDQIWFWFVEMKHENASSRDNVVANLAEKGALRIAAPLLWLQGKRCDGSKCQTRNQENYENVWKSLTHTTLPNGSRIPVAWLTIRALPTPQNSPHLATTLPFK